MGFFSFKTQDTNQSIPNKYSNKKTFTVYLHDDEGTRWQEKNYAGYGVFGGMDIYKLFAKMNGATNFNRDLWIRRWGNKRYLYPNLTRKKNWVWRNKIPKDCNVQGFFY